MAKKKSAAKPAKKKTTALARRRKAAPQPTALMRVSDPNGMLSQPLQDGPVLGSFALVEVKLTKREEKVLARKVSVDAVQIKPTGQPYLPHAFYRRWFSEAFGRMGWQLRPVNNPLRAPAKHEKAIQVVRGYLLYIHGKPVAYADGEHEFWTNNAEQSWGDALEATQASALRRCAKHLNVGLELWDGDFIEKFKSEHCVRYVVQVKDRQGNTRKKYHWALKTAPAPANVIGSGTADVDDAIDGEVLDDVPTRRAPKAAGSDGNGGMYLSPPQSRRLYMLATSKAGREWKDVLAWLKSAYNAVETGTKPDRYITLKRTDYQAVSEAVLAPGPLPKGRV